MGSDMPRRAKELGPLEVKRLRHPGTNSRNAQVAVGGVAGLLFQITPAGSTSWILRTIVGNARREIGLGAYPEISLAVARDKAREARSKIEAGVDPVEERRAVRSALVAAQRRGLTFTDAVARYLDAKLDAFKNPKHRQQWRNTLETYAIPELGCMLVSEIEVQDVLRVLDPIWRTKPETASRLRGRIEAVLSWATVAGHRTGDNPARWAGNLKELLPAASKVAKNENQPAVQLSDAARWFAVLRMREGISARALEFTTLTSARSGEVRGATWDEIDLDARTWTIPAARMKMGREHRVPLTDDAISLLKALPRHARNEQVFTAPRGGSLSDMSLSAVMRRLHEADLKAGRSGFTDARSGRPAVPHGLRSTFRDWVAELTRYPGDMAEVALAHKVSNAVEAAYRRGDQLERRRTMMRDWADFLTGKVSDNVVSFRGAL